VLVLEFAPNGNLHEQLHGSGGGTAAPMPWARRVSVALQVARALEYLHERCEPQVVHGDVKASNVLLDAGMGARLCDFGSARAGFSAAVVARPGPGQRPRVRAVLGSPGYVDPHYLRSGVVTKKSDVYSFGVLLLELLTGVQAFRDGRLLTASVAPKLAAAANAADGTLPSPRDVVSELVDRRLGCRYDARERRPWWRWRPRASGTTRASGRRWPTLCGHWSSCSTAGPRLSCPPPPVRSCSRL
jgi:serine/threonine protein kinase